MLDDQTDHVAHGAVCFRGDDVDAGHHDLANGLVRHLQDAVDHFALLLLHHPFLLTHGDEHLQLVLGDERARQLSSGCPQQQRGHQGEGGDDGAQHRSEPRHRRRHVERQALVVAEGNGFRSDLTEDEYEARQQQRVADAKQQIQAATKEAASQAVSAERRLSFEQWEQKFAAGRAEIENETVSAIEKFHHQADEHSRTAHAAAAEALRTELPRWLAPQLEQLTRDLTTRLAQEGAAQRNEHAQQLESMTDALRKAAEHGEYAATRLKTQAEQTQAQIAEHAESAAKTIEQAAPATPSTGNRPGRVAACRSQ